MGTNGMQSATTATSRNFKRTTYESDREDGSAHDYNQEMSRRSDEYSLEMHTLVATPAAMKAGERPQIGSGWRENSGPFLLHDAELSGLVAHYLRWDARLRKGVDG